MSEESASPRNQGLLLAIDCSSEQAGLALFDGVQTTELSWPAGRSQTTMLLAAIHQLLAQQDREPADLTAVAVTVGPGPFNGLRVGLSVAKGLVLGLGIRIIGVPTLEAAALPYAVSGGTVVPLVPAGRGRVVWSVYGMVDQVWTELQPARNSTLDELLATLPGDGPLIVSGELSTSQEERLRDDSRIRLPPVALRARRPAAVAALARQRLAAGDVDDPASLQAVYAGRDQA